MAPPSTFQHKRLCSDQNIRVLELLPAKSADAPIQCRLREVPMRKSRKGYEALSYVWGARMGTLPIDCEGQTLLVTPNCRDALLHLRRRFRPRTLWIDAICIDQTDGADAIRERNLQVSKMGEVYRWAQQAIVWLGPGDDSTPDLFRWLNRYAWLLRAYLALYFTGISKSSHFVERFWDQTHGKARDAQGHIIHEAYVRLLQNPWFLRVWTFQETTFARSVVAMCGRSTLSWSKLNDATGACDLEDLDGKVEEVVFQTQAGRMALKSLLQNLGHLGGYDQSRVVGWQGIDIFHRASELQFLTTLCNLQCTVPQDRIYGMQAMLEAIGLRMPTPDYTKSAKDVFEDAIVAHIRSREKLHLLTITLPPSEATGLSSWVPNWVTPQPQPTQMGVGEADETGVAFWQPQRGNHPFTASGGSKPMLLRHVPRQLTMRGKFLGTITERWASTLPISQHNIHNTSYCQDFMRVCREWCQMIDRLGTYPTGDSAEEAAFHTILSAAENGNRRLPDRRGSFLLWLDTMRYPQSVAPEQRHAIEAQAPAGTSDYVDAIIYFVEPDSAAPTTGVSPPSLSGHGVVASSSSNITEKERIRALHAQVKERANYALVTFDDGYLGLAFRTCREGDRLVVLAGGDVPLLLRKHGGHGFRVVAPVYVHGVMRGERWPESTETLDEITLV